MKVIPYNELERHFTIPKNWKAGEQVFYENIRRVPRKFKKKHKNILQNKKYAHLNLSVKLWILINPDYKRFLIKKVCES